MSVYMKVLVAISLTLTLGHVVVHSARVRRSESRMLTHRQKWQIVNRHNVLRAQEGAADMEYMTWNESLADAAADWAAQCVWDHGFPPLPGTNFAAYGQNLFIISGAEIDVSAGIQDWYNEKFDYDYDSLWCTPGKMCGHYTQVVWAASRQVGCAYHYCTTVASSAMRHAELLTCNYLPSGNFRGQKPFKKGRACSKCRSGAGWCNDRLCNSRCSEAGKDCTCEAVCYNCAKVDHRTCRCLCADGWEGPDCSERCEDRSELCDPSPGSAGWPPHWCNHDEHGSLIKTNCPLMCKLCKRNPDAEANKCPPVYGHNVRATVAAQSEKLVNLTKSPLKKRRLDDKVDKVVTNDNDNDSDNGSQHQQHHSTVAMLSYLILSLTVTWKALL